MKNTERLISLDVIRGFDMFWIIGGDTLFRALASYTDWSALNWWSEQLRHVKWEGFHFYDMIFPLFLFISGVAVPFSVSKRQQLGHTKKQIYYHAIKRLFILTVLGLLLANRGIKHFDWENYRYAHVLIRIGIGWFFATVIFLNTKIRGQLLWFWGLLLGYWAILTLIPVPGYGAGAFTPEGNFAGYIDRLFLPGKFYPYFPDHLDPEGILGHIPGTAMGLMGVLTGQFLMLRKNSLTNLKKGTILWVTGISFLGIGLLWNTVLPIIKIIWTSSFILYAGGWSLILFSIFYLVIDVWKLGGWWSNFFIVIGSNAIFIYFVTQSKIFNFRDTSNYFFEGIINLVQHPELQKVISSFTFLLVSWFILYFMFKRKIFLKI